MDFPILTAQQLASHIRAIRKVRKLTQAQLGSRLGLNQARIGKIERQPESVSVEQLIKLLTVLGARLVISVPDETLANKATDPTDW